jgi:hypothetical protein
MIKVEISVECVDDLGQVIHLLSKGADLVQSSYKAEDYQTDIEVIEETGKLSVTLLSDRREKFNAPNFNCCK